MNHSIFPAFVQDFAIRHPRIMDAVIGCLLVLVVLIELMTTEAPVVLYQAF